MKSISILKAKIIKKPQKSERNLHAKFWYTEKNHRYMFKLPHDGENAHFRLALLNEVFISKMCERLGVNCQQADFAEYRVWNTKGVRIKSFLQEGQTEVSLGMMKDDYIEKQLDELIGQDLFEELIYPALAEMRENKNGYKYAGVPLAFASEELLRKSAKARLFLLQHYDWLLDEGIAYLVDEYEEELDALCKIIMAMTDEDILRFAEAYAKKYNLQLDTGCVDQLCAYAVFDFLVAQDDRNPNNLSFIKDGNVLKLAPLFDNGGCFVCDQDGQITETFYNYVGLNILMTKLTKSKIDDKQSLVYKYVNRMKDFIKNEYDDFVEDFKKKYPECVDYLFINYNGEIEKPKREYLDDYFLSCKRTIISRIDELEQNKNIVYNKSNEVLKSKASKDNDLEKY